MAATVADVAIGYAVLTGRTQPEAVAESSVDGLRIGMVHEGYFARLIHPAIRDALEHVADVLAAAGAVLVETRLPDMDGALHTWGNIAWPEFSAAYPDLDLRRVGKQIADHYQHGQHLEPQARVLAREHSERIQAAFVGALHDVDALLLPATAYAAPRFDDNEIVVGDGESLNVFRGGPVWFTCPIDIGKVPALSIPAGFDASGLPLGVQLVGRFGEESTLLRIGRTFQELTTHHRLTPPLPSVASPGGVAHE